MRRAIALTVATEMDKKDLELDPSLRMRYEFLPSNAKLGPSKAQPHHPHRANNAR